MSRTILAACLAGAAAASGSCASSTDPSDERARTVRQYDARAFYTTTSYGLAGGSAWSHDDASLLVHADGTGIFNAYAMAAADGTLRPLTVSADDSTFAVSWFPADDRVLVTADRGGNELSHLYVREASGELRDLTPGEATKAQFVGWSGDRASFHVLTNERDARAFDLYRYAATDYARTLIFRNDDALSVDAISPDGRYVALGKPRTSADADVYLLDLQQPGATPQLVTAHEGNVEHGVYDFTRDSRALVYGTDEHGEFRQAWRYDIASGGKAPLVTADWDVMFVAFSESGRYRVSGVNADARTDVEILDTQTGQALTLPGLPAGDRGQVRFSRSECKVALLISSDTSPSDVYVVDLDAGTSARLTTALNPAIDEADLVNAEVIRYKSGDGLEIPSVLYRPHQASAADKVPALERGRSRASRCADVDAVRGVDGTAA